MPGPFHRIVLAALISSTTAAAQETDLFDAFVPDWRSHWQEQKLFSRPTRYQVEDAGETLALRADSRHANSGLIRKLEITTPAPSTQLSWNWKVDRSLTPQVSERERKADDYAARVCVVFEDSIIPLRTRSIHYVWAAHEPVGEIFPSPYSRNVAMIVLRSSTSPTKQWINERRDIVADYQRFFREPPKRISAVAIVVDTDNTRSEAHSWFRDLVLNTPPISMDPQP